MISVVVPVYKCKDSLSELVSRLENVLLDLKQEYEIIFVNDNCPENSWETLKTLANRNCNIKAINLSRNFGQHCAISAGLNLSKGDWVVVMDGDLQDQPEEISNLYGKANDGFDIVLARRVERKDSLLKRNISKVFYKALGFLSNTEIDPTVANFGIYKRIVIDSVISMTERHKFFPMMIKWVGFNTTYINIAHAPRKYGETSYSLWKLIELGLSTMLLFSDRPLRFIMQVGFLISIASVAGACFIIIKAIILPSYVIGWSSLFVSICFFSGIIIFFLGILGIYLSRVFEEVKARPTYIIKETININKRV